MHQRFAVCCRLNVVKTGHRDSSKRTLVKSIFIYHELRIFRTVAPEQPPVAITRSIYNAPGQNINSPLGSWDYAFEADNGIKQSAAGEMKRVSTGKLHMTCRISSLLHGNE